MADVKFSVNYVILKADGAVAGIDFGIEAVKQLENNKAHLDPITGASPQATAHYNGDNTPSKPYNKVISSSSILSTKLIVIAGGGANENVTKGVDGLGNKAVWSL
ncbi:hypothetical protein O1611_g8320 [Lasiodiplodia mahajangana]|uniref:Uncharacterized protein n=1 Tax=Lasiodiplodia mahajangana TaxID=1108764 RepID=A0ACC2JD71_9PEZI|nr:hypothetical protein O1611_g8320 [Lasiodiplodia mahajangana]